MHNSAAYQEKKISNGKFEAKKKKSDTFIDVKIVTFIVLKRKKKKNLLKLSVLRFSKKYVERS